MGTHQNGPTCAREKGPNCDGKVNEKDIPEIVFSTFAGGAYFKQGTLHAISLVGGQLVDKWTDPDIVQPGGGLAAGDLDGDGVPEIIGCMTPGPAGASCCDALAQNTGAIAFRADGSTLWTQPDTTKVHCGYEAPVIGDLDQDGFPEVVIGWTILDGKTGAVKKELDPASTWGAKLVGLSDLDGDGKLDITDGQRAYRADGSVLWDLRSGTDKVPPGYHAIGDFDKDGKPEVVIISSKGPHTMQLIQVDAASPATVRNIGEASLPAGVVVGFYAGTPPSGTLLGQRATKQTLYPAEAENVELPLPMAPPEVLAGTKLVYAVVDDGMPAHVWHECRTDNDTSEAKSGKCQAPK